jgi:hypothetical protein
LNHYKINPLQILHPNMRDWRQHLHHFPAELLRSFALDVPKVWAKPA